MTAEKRKERMNETSVWNDAEVKIEDVEKIEDGNNLICPA